MSITTTGVSKLGTGPDSVGLREFTVNDPGPGQVLLEVISARFARLVEVWTRD